MQFRLNTHGRNSTVIRQAPPSPLLSHDDRRGQNVVRKERSDPHEVLTPCGRKTQTAMRICFEEDAIHMEPHISLYD